MLDDLAGANAEQMHLALAHGARSRWCPDERASQHRERARTGHYPNRADLIRKIASARLVAQSGPYVIRVGCGLPVALRLLVVYTMVFRVEFRVSVASCLANS